MQKLLACMYIESPQPMAINLLTVLSRIGLFIINELGTRDLPDMYARSLRATGPRAEGIHIR